MQKNLLKDTLKNISNRESRNQKKDILQHIRHPGYNILDYAENVSKYTNHTEERLLQYKT